MQLAVRAKAHIMMQECDESERIATPLRSIDAPMIRHCRFILGALAFVALPAHAAAGDVEFALVWALPFAGLLLSIAIVPLFAAHFWHAHFGKVAAAWAVALLVPFALIFGVDATLHQVAHAMLEEYVPFVVILFALYTIAGGICFRGSFVGTPWLNTGILALGALLASIMGTTGASMLLIRPLLARQRRPQPQGALGRVLHRPGRQRRRRAVAAWRSAALHRVPARASTSSGPTRYLVTPTAFLVVALLAIYLLLDVWLYRKDGKPKASAAGGDALCDRGHVEPAADRARSSAPC